MHDAPASPYFTPVRLDGSFTCDRARLPAELAPPADDDLFGDRVLLGMPFAFGARGRANAVLLEAAPVEIPLDGACATYVVVVHAVEDRPTVYAPGLAEGALDGRALGGRVAEYALEYGDGERHTTPVLRRFAIQQTRIGWGSSPFAAAPAREPLVMATASEAVDLGRMPAAGAGGSATRHTSGRDAAEAIVDGVWRLQLAWLYALPNPRPERPLARLVLAPAGERAVVYAVTLATVAAHPLRPGRRRRVLAPLPDGATLDALGQLEGAAVDLGTVISARAALEYDHTRWSDGPHRVEPVQSASTVLIEAGMHPQARLSVGGTSFELASPPRGFRVLEPAERRVRLRVVDAATGTAVAARLHMHDEAGAYLPPLGHHRKVDAYWNEDSGAELLTDGNQYAYVDGACEADLPLGTVYVEAGRGLECVPFRRALTVSAETEEVVLALDRVLRWRERGWVSADTHVHFLSPATALLEGRAEDVNVVNLLAAQWGELFTNVGDFDGRTTFGARDLGGAGEFLVRVGSENRMQALGHISLLGYAGELIHPLSSGGPSESALGDAVEVTMAQWARRCAAQGGLVVMPHAPDPQLERAADIVLGLVDAVELMTFNPLRRDRGQLSAYGLADWYRYLNLGHRLPLVGGSDKMSAAALLGGIRTYARLDDGDLTYDGWMRAVRGGDTFTTVGPLVELRVEGARPGGAVELPAGGGTVAIEWEVASAVLPFDRVEVVAGGLVAGEERFAGGILEARGAATVRCQESTWIALRVRGSYHARPEDIAAHTSAVFVTVAGSSHYAAADAAAILDQIEGSLAYLDTLAPRPAARAFRAMRAELEGAYNRLHQRMHREGVFHRHGPLHDPAAPHEH